MKQALLALCLCTSCGVGVMRGPDKMHVAFVIGTAEVVQCEGATCDTVRGHPVSTNATSIILAILEAAGTAFALYVTH